MLHREQLLRRNNYERIKYIKLGELREEIKKFFNKYATDEWYVFELYKNKETDDIIYVGYSSSELYLDTLDGEPYDDLTKHETFKDYVRVQDYNYGNVYAHKDNINTLIELDVVFEYNNKYYSYTNTCASYDEYGYDEDDYDE